MRSKLSLCIPRRSQPRSIAIVPPPAMVTRYDGFPMTGLLRTNFGTTFNPTRVFLAILFLGLFAMAARNVIDPDLWWHLKTGEYIAQHHSVPHTDPFSYTRAGEPWVAHEWLAELLLYQIQRTTGFAGLILIFAAVLCAAFHPDGQSIVTGTRDGMVQRWTTPLPPKSGGVAEIQRWARDQTGVVFDGLRAETTRMIAE